MNHILVDEIARWIRSSYRGRDGPSFKQLLDYGADRYIELVHPNDALALRLFHRSALSALAKECHRQRLRDRERGENLQLTLF